MFKKGIALITGATSGIGKASALALAKDGYDVIVTGRTEKEVHAVVHEIASKTKVKVVGSVFDVRDKTQVQEAIESLPTPWQKITVLVNNAGLALGRNPINEGSLDDWEIMINTNVNGLLYVTRAVIPLMVKQKKGHIINIGSIAGREVYPNGNIYCMTKHAVIALSKCMRLDLVAHNIKATVVNPGHVLTNFAKTRYRGDKAKIKAAYEGFTPLDADDVARCVVFAASQPANVVIDEILVSPLAQAGATYIYRKK